MATEAACGGVGLQAQKWVDVKTRAVFVDFSMYSPNVDLFAATRIVFEFFPTGVVSPYGTTRSIILNRYAMKTVTDFIQVGASRGTGREGGRQAAASVHWQRRWLA